MSPLTLPLVDWRHRITTDAGIRTGLPCVAGTRIAVSDVVGWFAGGMTEAEILQDFPDLSADDVRACLLYAAECTNSAPRPVS